MIKHSFPVRIFDKNRFLKDLSINISRLRDALAREFIRTTLVNIPVWSGASQATLIPLAILVKETEVIPNKPIRTNRTDDYHGIDAGISHGKGELRPTGFIFSHDIKQFLEQDWGDVAIAAGSAQVSKILQTQGSKVIPSWAKYLVLRA